MYVENIFFFLKKNVKDLTKCVCVYMYPQGNPSTSNAWRSRLHDSPNNLNNSSFSFLCIYNNMKGTFYNFY